MHFNQDNIILLRILLKDDGCVVACSNSNKEELEQSLAKMLCLFIRTQVRLHSSKTL